MPKWQSWWRIKSRKKALRDQVLDAHKTLMQLNHRNFEAFRDLVCALEAQCSESAQKSLRATG